MVLDLTENGSTDSNSAMSIDRNSRVSGVLHLNRDLTMVQTQIRSKESYQI
jgi:hypothetical protein